MNTMFSVDSAFAISLLLMIREDVLPSSNSTYQSMLLSSKRLIMDLSWRIRWCPNLSNAVGAIESNGLVHQNFVYEFSVFIIHWFHWFQFCKNFSNDFLFRYLCQFSRTSATFIIPSYAWASTFPLAPPPFFLRFVDNDLPDTDASSGQLTGMFHLNVMYILYKEIRSTTSSWT